MAPSKAPVLITADQVTYDRDLGVVVAAGHVEVSQDNRILKANTLTYNERQKTVTASGDVALLDESGNVAFADYMELSDDLKNAVILHIRMLLADKSRMAAASGRRVGPVDSLDKAIYSPCKPCESDPLQPPIWQLKADRVVHDNIEHTIVYHNAWMEIFGLPVFYTPYLSHPDPTVKRKSGFLAPRFSSSGQLGTQFQAPYYWVTGPDSDVTLDPIISTKANPVLSGAFRQRFEDGKFQISGSSTIGDRTTTVNGVTTTEDDVFRGHVFTLGQFDLDSHWRAGFDINRASDADYLRLYGFPNNFNRSLDSTTYVEGFDGRSYASAQAYAFQGLRDSDNNDQAPIVAPLLNYSLVSNTGPAGQYWTIDADMMSLNRIEGRDSNRLSGKLAWVLPYTAPAGDIYKLTASLRADAYFVNGVNPNSNNPVPTGNTENGFAGRVFPEITFDWRYPFVRRAAGFNQVFEPIFSASVAPSGGNNPGLIPNEDSQDFQFDEDNLFSGSRLAGLDRVDNGQRINYGFKYSVYGGGGGHSSIMLGQSYQFNDDNAFAAGIADMDQLSDIVGALSIAPSKEVDLLYRFQYRTQTMSFLRQELGLHVDTGRVNASIAYAFLDGSISNGSSNGQQQQEVYAFGTLKLDENWSLSTRGRYDLEANQALEYGGGVTYQNECITLSLLASRSNYSTDEIEPDTRFLLVINFKYLGGTNFAL